MDLFEAMNGTTRRLSHVLRYSSLPVQRSENVAEHSFYVAFYGYLIALDIEPMSHNGRKKVDPYMVMEKAMLHDFSEAISGDIIRSFKHGTPGLKEIIDQADDVNMAKIADKYGVSGPYIHTMWKLAKDGSLEGKIVMFADFLSMIAYCREEHLLGNKHLDHVLYHGHKDMVEIFGDDEYLRKYLDQVFPTGDYRDAYRTMSSESVPEVDEFVGRLP